MAQGLQLGGPAGLRRGPTSTAGSVVWSSQMKTTLNLDDELLERAKALAKSEGITLTALFEDALRARLATRPTGRQAFKLEVPVVRGTRPPSLDVADRGALYDLAESGR